MKPRSLAPVSRFGVLTLVFTCFFVGGCRGRVTVDDSGQVFDAATETLRAEAAQLAARADSRLRTLTDSTAAAQVRASRDSILAALDALATTADSTSLSRRQALRDLDARILERLRRLDSLAASGPAPARVPTDESSSRDGESTIPPSRR